MESNPHKSRSSALELQQSVSSSSLSSWDSFSSNSSSSSTQISPRIIGSRELCAQSGDEVADLGSTANFCYSYFR